MGMGRTRRSPTSRVECHYGVQTNRDEVGEELGRRLPNHWWKKSAISRNIFWVVLRLLRIRTKVRDSDEGKAR